MNHIFLKLSKHGVFKGFEDDLGHEIQFGTRMSCGPKGIRITEEDLLGLDIVENLIEDAVEMAFEEEGY
jgi:hypothetical protein